MNTIQCYRLRMNATILLQIMPDLRSKYSLIVDGERLGDMKTLHDAIVARDCLKEHDFSTSEARVILHALGIEAPDALRDF
jgi:hypothetical protein